MTTTTTNLPKHVGNEPIQAPVSHECWASPATRAYPVLHVYVTVLSWKWGPTEGVYTALFTVVGLAHTAVKGNEWNIAKFLLFTEGKFLVYLQYKSVNTKTS